MPDTIAWRDPFEGLEFEPATVHVGREYQAEKLSCCGIDPAVFGEDVDPSFFILLGIQAGVSNGISAEGNVNMLQVLKCVRPAQLGEVLTVRGGINRVTEVPRGQAVSTWIEFVDNTGSLVIDASRISLKPDPAKSAQRGAGERPAPVVTNPEDLPIYSSHHLTPDAVKRYSSEGNSIHYDMEAANKAGFRAPLIGGGMGVHFLTAGLWQGNKPSALHLDVSFRRPIFWDHAFAVRAARDGSAICLASAGKVLTEARVHTLVPSGA